MINLRNRLTTTYETSTSLAMASATIKQAVNGTSQFLTSRIYNA